MKNIKTFHKLFEEVYDYKKTSSSDRQIYYNFKADDLRYTVSIWHDEAKHKFKEYEIEFSFSGQKHEGDKAGKSLKHLNSVLNTVAEVTEKTVKEYKIEEIKINPAAGEGDTDFFADTLRYKIYMRFFNNRYGKGIAKQLGKFIIIDMKEVFPNVFSDEKYKSKSKSEQVIDELVRISDADPNREGIERGLGGTNDDQFIIDTDFIDSEEHGTIYIVIDVWVEANEYTIEWDMMDKGEEGFESFESFDELLTFLKEFQ